MVYILGFFFGGVKASQKPRHMSSRILGKMLSSWKAIDMKMCNQSKGNCGGLPTEYFLKSLPLAHWEMSFCNTGYELFHHWLLCWEERTNTLACFQRNQTTLHKKGKALINQFHNFASLKLLEGWPPSYSLHPYHCSLNIHIRSCEIVVYKPNKKTKASQWKFIFNLLTSTNNKNSNNIAIFKMKVKNDRCFFDLYSLWLTSWMPDRDIQRVRCGPQAIVCPGLQ